jgi:two-component system nitrogen regulation sensor histidine kinase GlnL
MRALTLAVIALLHLVLALAVWRAKPEGHINRLFALQTLTFAGWTFGNALMQTRMWLHGASMLTFASASLIPSAMLTFTIYYPDQRRKSAALSLRLAVFVGGVFALASVATDWIVYDTYFGAAGLSRRTGPLYPFFAIYFITVYIAVLAVFARKWRLARGRERTQLNYYGLGLLVIGLGGITSNLIFPAITGRSSLSHVGPCFGLPFVLLTAHAIFRYRFMDLRLVVHRGLTFTIAVLISLVPALALLLLGSRPVFKHLSLSEALLTTVAFLAVALLIPPTRDLAERFLDRYVYRTRVNTQHLLRQATTNLTHALDLPRMLDVIINTIDVAVKPEGVAIYLEHGGSLRLSVARVLDARGAFNAPIEPAAPIVDHATIHATPLLRDELDAPSDVALREVVHGTSWALTLPLVADHRLVGLIAVGRKRSGDAFFSEDVDALTTLANHAGSAVKNASLYAQVALANEYVNNIVGAMQNGVVATDMSGIITLINPAARDMLGLMADAVLKVDDLPSPLRMVLQQVLSDGLRHTADELHLEQPSRAQALPLFCTASSLNDHAGDRAGAVAVFSDLTPLKELDHQRSRAETLANLQRATQALAHEIGNPLVPIKTLAKLLPERLGDRTFAQNLSRIVSREIERIERLVARLQRVAPQMDLTYTNVDLRVPMRHATEILEAAAASQDTCLETALAASPVSIIGDSAEIEELFINLLTNALEAVVDQPAASRRVQASVAIEGTRAVAQIRDSGKGIPLHLMERIFDPFFTTKARGSGLGLAICSGIAERHRGRLTASSAEDGGAIFAVTLPLADDSSGTGSRPEFDRD